jgi:TolA-binding protein
VEHRTQQALDEARAARSEASRTGASGAAAATPDGGVAAAAGGSSQEVQDYRAAYAEWRAENAAGCIDRFTKFLQTYPSSEHADDATYWLADCYFKQGNFSAAVLRFDDVARQYPKGDRAADALYRQGEALLRMGHARPRGTPSRRCCATTRAPRARRRRSGSSICSAPVRRATHPNLSDRRIRS